MKKGYTIIEIIISISIILVVGISATFFLINKSNDNKVDKVTKEILEAANVFINTEKDDKGNSYKNGILSGGKGLQLSVKNLVDKGYIKDEQVRKLNLDEENSYILAAITTNDESICGEGVIEFTPSWITSSEPIYLCDYSNNENSTSIKFLDYIIEKNGSNIIELNNITYESNYEIEWNVQETSSNSVIYSKENGLYKKTDDTHYFRGVVENNYIRFNYNTDYVFRIVSFNPNELKLISNSSVGSEYLFNCIDKNSDEFSESIIGCTIADWYNYLKTGHQSIFNNYIPLGLKDKYKEMFKTTSYCKKHDSYNLNPTSTTSNMFGDCVESIESSYGLLTVNEAIYAGLSGSVYQSGYWELFGNIANKHQESSNYEYFIINNSWLSNGSSFLLFDKISTETLNNNSKNRLVQTFYGVINSKQIEHSYYTDYNWSCAEEKYEDGKGMTLGTIIPIKFDPYCLKYCNNTSTEEACQKSNVKENFANLLKPVITIDPNKISNYSGSGTKTDPYVISP